MGSTERGAVAVETVFMAIFLLILVSGIIDVGRGIFSRISIEDAAQEAATFASYESPLTITDIKQRAVEAIDSPEIVDTDVTVNCYIKGGSQRDTRLIEVSVTYEQA